MNPTNEARATGAHRVVGAHGRAPLRCRLTRQYRECDSASPRIRRGAIGFHTGSRQNETIPPAPACRTDSIAFRRLPPRRRDTPVHVSPLLRNTPLPGRSRTPAARIDRRRCLSVLMANMHPRTAAYARRRSIPKAAMTPSGLRCGSATPYMLPFQPRLHHL